MANANERKWTVFFLIKSIHGDDVRNLIMMLRQILATQYPESISIILCVNFDRKNIDAVMSQDEHLITTDSSNDFTTIFLRVVSVVGSPNHLEIIGERTNFDITNENDLTSFFAKYILAPNAAKRYLLFTWDHGDGFQIFSGIGRGGNADETSPQLLTMDELKNAIQLAMPNKKIDLVIMMNCCMQIFDTGYAFRNVVEVLVAPQTLLNFNHYDYKSIFNHLADNPDITGEEMGKFTIDLFKNPVDPEIAVEDVAISACDVSQFAATAIDLNELARTLLRRIRKGDFEIISKAFRNAAPMHYGKRFIDIRSLMTTFLNSGNFKNEEILLTNLLEKLNGLVMHYHPIDYPKGVSLLSPVTVGQKDFRDKRLDDFLSKTEFRANTQWGKLIDVMEKIDEVS